jgi:hypothetical protein
MPSTSKSVSDTNELMEEILQACDGKNARVAIAALMAALFDVIEGTVEPTARGMVIGQVKAGLSRLESLPLMSLA